MNEKFNVATEIDATNEAIRECCWSLSHSTDSTIAEPSEMVLKLKRARELTTEIFWLNQKVAALLSLQMIQNEIAGCQPSGQPLVQPVRR